MKKIKKLFEYVKEQIISKHHIRCVILREQGPTGVKIVFEFDKWANNQAPSFDAKRSIRGEVLSGGIPTLSYWFINNKNKKKSAAKSDEEDDLLSEAEDELIEEETEAINKQQKDFWNKVTFILTKANALQKNSISFCENY
jgi:hypothetical protein